MSATSGLCSESTCLHLRCKHSIPCLPRLNFEATIGLKHGLVSSQPNSYLHFAYLMLHCCLQVPEAHITQIVPRTDLQAEQVSLHVHGSKATAARGVVAVVTSGGELSQHCARPIRMSIPIVSGSLLCARARVASSSCVLVHCTVGDGAHQCSHRISCAQAEASLLPFDLLAGTEALCTSGLPSAASITNRLPNESHSSSQTPVISWR